MRVCAGSTASRRGLARAAALALLVAAIGVGAARGQEGAGASLAPAAAPAEAAGTAPPLADPLAVKAAAVLERHCARCHQEGKLKGLVPSGALANITRLGDIARVSSLVEPQFPDASRLYLSMVERRMPRDAYHDGERMPEPSDDEIQAVRDWIAGLPPRADTCPGRRFIPPQATQAAIRTALATEPDAAKTTRFLTLTHLYNACVPDTELAALRQAAAKLMNSLAWSVEPAILEPVDSEQTVLRLRLPSLGWVGAHWEKLARAFPYAASPALKMPAEVVEETATMLPALPADWVAAAATRPRLYADLLGLPAELDDLMKILSLDVEATSQSGAAARMGIAQSQVSPANRLVESHPLLTGGRLWLAYDFAGSSGEKDIFRRPLGPDATPGVANPFRHDSVQVMFNLPNGFLAYAVHAADGRRLDSVPGSVERPDAVGHQATESGGGCIACHSGGPVPVGDDLRPRLVSAGEKGLLDALHRVLKSEVELRALFADEVHRFRRALVRAHADPDLRIDGLEPIAALRQRYERNVPLARAAAEFGLPPDEFRARLAGHAGPAQELAFRLLQGSLHRSELAALFTALANGQPAEGTGAASSPVAAPASAPHGGGLVVLSDRTVYKSGDLVTFTARASTPCRLTLISVNSAGKGIVLFPNEFEQDNALSPGREVRVPGHNAPYNLRLRERGIETLIGVCTQTAKLADGIQPDYEKQRFTILGDWRNFIRSALQEEAAERLNPDKDKDNRRRRKVRGRNEPAEPARNGKPDVQSRTAIRYLVE